MDSLICADNSWMLMAIMCVSASIAIYLEQKYAWASQLSGCVIALVLALLLVNANIIPTHAAIYDDVVWNYAVPMAIPLLLLQANMKVIWRETGRLLSIFLIGAAGTIVGAVLGVWLLGSFVDELPKVAAMMTGSYIGGSLNLMAIAASFKPAGTTISAAIVADNLNMAIYFLLLIGIAGNSFFRHSFRHPHIEEVESCRAVGKGQTLAATYWNRKDISLKDIAMNISYAVVVVTVSNGIGSCWDSLLPSSDGLGGMIHTFLSNSYVWMTLLSMIFSTCCGKTASSMHGAQELGTYFIYLFFFVIGVPASIMEIVRNAPVLLLFCLIMVLTNMAFCFIGGKVFHFNLEDIIIASNANIGGPTTAAGMAISQGWNSLVGPAMLVGTFGYVIGTYLGIIVGGFLGA
jgi:uncharacterized membrane protein